jgi:hypothetical protein
MQTVEASAALIAWEAENICAMVNYILWLHGCFCGPCMPPNIFRASRLAEADEQLQTIVARLPAEANP